MVHGKYLVSPASFATSPQPFEGVNVAVSTNGYPTADAAGIMVAAGLTANDYTIFTTAQNGGARVPAVPANGVAFVPNSLVGTAAATTCFVSYSLAPNSVPTVSATTTACE
jgi:MSHA pilin protein MshA